MLKIYPERPAAVLRQVAGDLVTVVWVYLWIRAAVWLHGLVDMLATPGAQLERLAGSLAVNLDAAGKAIGHVPLIGGDVTAPLTRAAGTAQSIAEAGRQQQQWAHDAAYTLPTLLLVVPLGLVLFVWLPLRIRRIRRTAASVEMRGSDAGLDLLALRALARQSVTRLARTHPDVAAGWRLGDPAAIEGLAALELRRVGLRPPTPRPIAYDLPTPVDPWSAG
ncbi:hypothetical protein BJ973_004473 [Actinoplanes tereljensis]|uniref:hypothetical protein n=1 Tax=Paractinoplanes tereljensis TaxID=571912 RepID=UPI0019448A8A|nr:hypothetical protein [Actinoplanes tereljensis]